jgi:RimJ/RimL family protein N-acetyltransferase
MSVLPITTARLILRVMQPSDAPAFARYRNLDEIARYQDWDLPYGIDDAHRALAAQDGHTDLTDGDWTQVAIEHAGTVIGDLAVSLDTAGRHATIGYTLAPEYHGRGFASEAAGALVDAVLALGVHRILATLDPANTASMRVVEGLGFRFEGISREVAIVRGEWVDDARFALLATDRRAWLERPRTADHVELVEVTHQLVGAVQRLETHRFQQEFVAPMADSFVDALVPETDPQGGGLVPWFRAIRADGEIVGFAMLSLATPTSPHPFLWRLLIDRMHQRRGIGRRVVALLVDQLAAEGHHRLLTSWVEAPGGPRPFYERLGFVPTGELEDDEIVAALDLR